MASILVKNISSKSVSRFTGMISLPSWIPALISPVLSSITIAHWSFCLSHQAIEVAFFVACGIIYVVNAPPISISIFLYTFL